ncbi:endoplasmic oxidoreductin [Nadsonia fulvescens var. elongata DSM 6958]|uniref:Endoplasmic oxidoreductin n=1 Tax=Nadsonia fulvescens var. elongata DSM 6958 TaxID=857566 RepID=A0A1E3PQ35_9ASCO|nr:endoplasmic oxidoreductin [Nadsonia fulvescens var. elongata DSM 6958]
MLIKSTLLLGVSLPLIAANLAFDSVFGSQTSAVLQYIDPAFCSSPTGYISDGCGATYKEVEDKNKVIRPLIKDLVTTDYFKYYKIDLYERKCKHWADESLCGNRACAVDTIDDEDNLPDIWKPSNLGKLAEDSYSTNENGSQSEVGDYGPNDFYAEFECPGDNDKDFCVPEDETFGSPGVYVCLTDNPERFTGYIGASANKVWRAIYQENCFSSKENETSDSTSDNINRAGVELGNFILGQNKKKSHDIGDDKAMNFEGQCLEKRIFYRLVSGMHASVSTHLSYEYLNTTTGKWGPNLDQFMSRVGNYPERISNIYFNYALVSRAVAKLKDYLGNITFSASSSEYDTQIRKQILSVAEKANSSPGFNETMVFSTPEALTLKDEFRMHFRNVSSIIDCTGCDKCRLWGKIQVSGYGTALKLLFGLPDTPNSNTVVANEVISNLRRTELVALINTYQTLSKSIEAITYFRDQVRSRLEIEPEVIAEEDIPLTLEDDEHVDEIDIDIEVSGQETEGFYDSDLNFGLGKDYEEYDYEDEDITNNNTDAQSKSIKKIWVQAFREELAAVGEALKFIVSSWFDTPKIAKNAFLHYASVWWNRFVGREAHVVEREQQRFYGSDEL